MPPSSAPGRGLTVAATVLAIGSVLALILGASLIAFGMWHSSAPPAAATASVDDETPRAAAAPVANQPGLLSRVFSAFSSGGPARAGYSDGHPVGLYMMTRYWMATGSLEKAAWYFTKDGRVYVDPKNGFSDQDLAAHNGQQGTVTADGDTMAIQWKGGSEEKGKIEKDKSGFAWDMGLFAPAAPFDSPSQLAGKWEGGNSVHSNGGWAAASATLDLRPDGTLTRDAAASFRAESRESIAKVGGTSGSNGKWNLDGYILTLTFDDGTTQRGVAFPFDDDRAKRFYFNGTMFKKL